MIEYIKNQKGENRTFNKGNVRVFMQRKKE